MTALYQQPQGHFGSREGGEEEGGLLLGELHLGGRGDAPVGLTASSSWGFALREQEEEAEEERGAAPGGGSQLEVRARTARVGTDPVAS